MVQILQVHAARQAAATFEAQCRGNTTLLLVVAQRAQLIEPKIVVALGATGAACLVGNAVRITKDRDTIFHLENLPPVLVTIHPSYILRIRDRLAANAERLTFVDDLRQLKEVLA